MFGHEEQPNTNNDHLNFVASSCPSIKCYNSSKIPLKVSITILLVVIYSAITKEDDSYQL